jgi:hypothetical protein
LTLLWRVRLKALRIKGHFTEWGGFEVEIETRDEPSIEGPKPADQPPSPL